MKAEAVLPPPRSLPTDACSGSFTPNREVGRARGLRQTSRSLFVLVYCLFCTVEPFRLERARFRLSMRRRIHSAQPQGSNRPTPQFWQTAQARHRLASGKGRLAILNGGTAFAAHYRARYST